MAKAVSATSGGTARAVVLAESTRCALSLPSSHATSGSEVAAGALRLLDAAPEISDLANGLIASLDELVVGVVEAVEECVLAPPFDCANVRARAEVEAVSWVDDFIADDATNDDVVVQQAMFQLACLVADAVAEALTVRTHAIDRPTKAPGLRLETLALRRVVDELWRRGSEAVRWSVQLTTPLGWLRK